jgi:hypothetical protein
MSKIRFTLPRRAIAGGCGIMILEIIAERLRTGLGRGAALALRPLTPKR